MKATKLVTTMLFVCLLTGCASHIKLSYGFEYDGQVERENKHETLVGE